MSDNQPVFNELDPNETLAAIATDEDVKDFFAIVVRTDGTFTYHSNHPDSNLVLRWIEEFKLKLLRGDFVTGASEEESH